MHGIFCVVWSGTDQRISVFVVAVPGWIDELVASVSRGSNKRQRGRRHTPCGHASPTGTGKGCTLWLPLSDDCFLRRALLSWSWGSLFLARFLGLPSQTDGICFNGRGKMKPCVKGEVCVMIVLWARTHVCMASASSLCSGDCAYMWGTNSADEYFHTHTHTHTFSSTSLSQRLISSQSRQLWSRQTSEWVRGLLPWQRDTRKEVRRDGG